MSSEEFRSEMPATGMRPETAPQRAENANAALVRRLVTAFEAGDAETVRGLLAESIVWHYPGRSVITGEHRGPDGVLNFMRRVSEESNDTVQLEIISIMTDGDYATLWAHSTGTRKGKTLDVKEAVIFLIRDNQIAEVWHRPEQPADDEFFS